MPPSVSRNTIGRCVCPTRQHCVSTCSRHACADPTVVTYSHAGFLGTAMHQSEGASLLSYRQGCQHPSMLRRQSIRRPPAGRRGVRVEVRQAELPNSSKIVVAGHHHVFHAQQQVQAGRGVRSVSNHVTEAPHLVDSLHGLRRRPIPRTAPPSCCVCRIERPLSRCSTPPAAASQYSTLHLLAG